MVQIESCQLYINISFLNICVYGSKPHLTPSKDQNSPYNYILPVMIIIIAPDNQLLKIN